MHFKHTIEAPRGPHDLTMHFSILCVDKYRVHTILVWRQIGNIKLRRAKRLANPKGTKTMPVLKTAAIAIVATLVGAYAIGQFTSKSLQTRIDIDAPVDVVWKTLTDTAEYAAWNPFIKHLEGDLVVGNTLAATIQGVGQSPMNFTPKVLVSDENKELRWIGGAAIRGIFDGEHYFILEQAPNGGTRFTHGENFRGMLVLVIMPFIGESTRAGFEAMNKALKARAEAAV